MIMKSCEEYVTPESDYYVYSPSMAARQMFFYPLYSGHFIYKSGYSLHRDSYDSYLLMYIQSGSLTLEYEGSIQQAPSGHFVLIDCYRPHAYSTDHGCEALWCHFDGVTAQAHYRSIVSHLGNVFSLPDPYPISSKLLSIYQMFAGGQAVREPLVSKYLNDILVSFLLYSPANVRLRRDSAMAEEIISYINEHFNEELSVGQLADRAGLSQYHFIRTFKKETGFTPHEYIVHTRISTAKYLLKNSRLPVKDICFSTGFSCESVFCSTFKKYLKMTPAQYRTTDTADT